MFTDVFGDIRSGEECKIWEGSNSRITKELTKRKGCKSGDCSPVKSPGKVQEKVFDDVFVGIVDGEGHMWEKSGLITNELKKLKRL